MTLDTIRKAAKAALKDRKDILKCISTADEQEADAQRDRLRRNIAKATDRLGVLEKMIGKLYEDMIAGKISDYLKPLKSNRSYSIKLGIKQLIPNVSHSTVVKPSPLSSSQIVRN